MTWNVPVYDRYMYLFTAACLVRGHRAGGVMEIVVLSNILPSWRCPLMGEQR